MMTTRRVVYRTDEPRTGTLALSAFAWLLASASVALACPLCKDAIAGDAKAAVLSWTTLLMIAVPFALVGVIGGSIALIYWRAARAVANKTADLGAPEAEWLPTWAERENET